MNRSKFLVSATIGIIVYVVLDAIEALIALPLRESSARISAVLLNALSLSVSRSGTILSTPNFTFDVEAPCSGSTTLRVLVTACVIWCSIHPRLTMARRILCMALSIPIALFANGVRVAALVGLGDLLLKPVEGFPHYAIGVAGFVMAMALVYLLTCALSVKQTEVVSWEASPVIWIVAGLALLYVPVWSWLASRWTTFPHELTGLIFIGSGLALVLVTFCRFRVSTPSPRLGGALFAVTVLAYLLANAIDLRVAQGACMLMGLTSLVCGVKGRRVALIILPLVVVVGLGLPMVGHGIEIAVSKVNGHVSMVATFMVRLVAAGLLVVGWFILYSWSGGLAMVSDPGPPIQTRKPAWGSIGLILAVGILVQAYQNSQASTFDQTTRLELSYLQGDWTGEDNSVSEVAETIIGKERITSRLYAKNGDRIEVIVTSTGADRRRAHPPEGCMTGTGWSTQSQVVTNKLIGGSSQSVSQFRFVRDAAAVDFVYWFTDGVTVYATFHQMMKEDLLRRLRGIRTNWYLFRIMGQAERSGLDEFLKSFDPQIVKKVP